MGQICPLLVTGVIAAEREGLRQTVIKHCSHSHKYQKSFYFSMSAVISFPALCASNGNVSAIESAFLDVDVQRQGLRCCSKTLVSPLDVS